VGVGDRADESWGEAGAETLSSGQIAEQLEQEIVSGFEGRIQIEMFRRITRQEHPIPKQELPVPEQEQDSVVY